MVNITKHFQKDWYLHRLVLSIDKSLTIETFENKFYQIGNGRHFITKELTKYQVTFSKEKESLKCHDWKRFTKNDHNSRFQITYFSEDKNICRSFVSNFFPTQRHSLALVSSELIPYELLYLHPKYKKIMVKEWKFSTVNEPKLFH